MLYIFKKNHIWNTLLKTLIIYKIIMTSLVRLCRENLLFFAKKEKNILQVNLISTLFKYYLRLWNLKCVKIFWIFHGKNKCLIFSVFFLIFLKESWCIINEFVTGKYKVYTFCERNKKITFNSSGAGYKFYKESIWSNIERV